MVAIVCFHKNALSQLASATGCLAQIDPIIPTLFTASFLAIRQTTVHSYPTQPLVFQRNHPVFTGKQDPMVKNKVTSVP